MYHFDSAGIMLRLVVGTGAAHRRYHQSIPFEPKRRAYLVDKFYHSPGKALGRNFSVSDSSIAAAPHRNEPVCAEAYPGTLG